MHKVQGIKSAGAEVAIQGEKTPAVSSYTWVTISLNDKISEDRYARHRV